MIKNVSFIEAFRHNDLPIVAFQYHPEEFNCSFAIGQIKGMLETFESEEEALEKEKTLEA